MYENPKMEILSLMSEDDVVTLSVIDKGDNPPVDISDMF